MIVTLPPHKIPWLQIDVCIKKAIKAAKRDNKVVTADGLRDLLYNHDAKKSCGMSIIIISRVQNDVQCLNADSLVIGFKNNLVDFVNNAIAISDYLNVLYSNVTVVEFSGSVDNVENTLYAE